MPLALEGVRVLDWTAGQQGPVATTMLADLGADVIKIEDPDGDIGRDLLPGRGALPGKRNYYFEGNNRNKRGIVLDLKKDDAREVLYRLVEKSDVFVQNWRKMVRFLDYNDYYTLPPPVHSGSHPSEVIPPILAVGEREHSSGKQVLESIVAGYELSARFVHGCTVRQSLELRGWNSDLRAGFMVPVAVGRLLGLNAGQVENAIGTAMSLNMVLGILDASKEEYTMTKNLRFPMTAYDAILATLLARRGFTGPRRVLEGSRGFAESVLQGEFDWAKFTDFRGFKMMETGFKLFAADATTHGHITATIDLVKEHDIKPEDVKQIRIWATSRNVEHTGQAEKRYPGNKETADHSSYYLTAIAIKDRQIGPAQYTVENFESPVVRQLNDKIVSFEVQPDLDRYPTAGASEITTTSGKVYRKEVPYPKGARENPASDRDIEEKFRNMASKYMTDGRIDTIVKTISELEKLEDIGELMRLFRFNKKAA